MRILSPVGFALVALALSSCGPAEEAARTPSQLPVLVLSEKPTLEIGVMEGDVHYTFQDIVSILPLPSGELAVSDGGANEITLYAPDGTFVRRWGGRGKGPGEFRVLSHLYPGPGDSILALDNITRKVSVFDTLGTFARQVPVSELSGDTIYSADAWLYGRYWVEGGLDDATRSRVRRALDALPQPRSAPGFRVVRVASDGRLWIREPGVTPQGMRGWTVLSATGTPEAVADIPESFDPQYLGPSRIIGRWRGESDVNFVRAYDVEKTDRTAPTPTWLAVPADSVNAPPADEQEVRAQIAGAIKNMASRQEIYYSTHFSYTSNVDSLKWEAPEGLDVSFVNAGPRGWAAAFTRPDFDRVCALGYGFTIPPGFPMGAVTCGPAVSKPTSSSQEP